MAKILVVDDEEHIRLLYSEDLRRQLGQEGRKKVVERFNVRTILHKYEELFNSVLARIDAQAHSR